MKLTVHIIKIVSAILLTGVLPSSCIYDDEEYPGQPSDATIRVNTLVVNGSRAPKVMDDGDNTFMVLFWRDKAHLESPSDAAAWPAPYLAGHAPQPVTFYQYAVYDTRYPYPGKTDDYLYATGYSPGTVLHPDAGQGYRRLSADTGDDTRTGRYDFLGCDVWSDVYKGSQDDPFSKDKNKLYFRHLAAKLVIYAYRDKTTMELQQYVRNVMVKDLHMDIGDGQPWRPMYTPSAFEWKELTYPDDFTGSYQKSLNEARLVTGNIGVTSWPAAGYKTAGVAEFAGDDPDFEMQKHATDRVPIDGMVIDSCYVCNPIADNGTPLKAQKSIRLKMDISAEMSFDHNFPMKDDPSGTPGDGSGSTTDDLTFTRTWPDVVLDAIYEVNVDADGKVTETKVPVTEFKPGYEYRIHIHFNRTGVNIVAQELPWNYGGVHYITIPGGNTQQQDTPQQNEDTK